MIITVDALLWPGLCSAGAFVVIASVASLGYTVLVLTKRDGWLRRLDAQLGRFGRGRGE